MCHRVEIYLFIENIYLNEFDQELLKRNVLCIRYVDDIEILAKEYPRDFLKIVQSILKKNGNY